MERGKKETARERLLLALDMANFGVGMMRQNLKRRHPRETSRQIDERPREWLESRPLV